MAKGLRELRARIRSIKNTQQITKAMELVSASKLRRAQERATSSKPYAEKMRALIAHIAGSALDVSHPMLERRPVKNTGFILITSDRGLAGGYNANVIRAFMERIKSYDASTVKIVAIGRKGYDHIIKRGLPVTDSIIGLDDFPRYQDIQALASKTVGYFTYGEVDELYIVYNEFVSPLTQRPKIVRLLPLTGAFSEQEQVTAQHAAQGTSIDYLYEPSPEEVLSVLLPRYAETLIFSALLEAKAGEHAARMTAMGAATDAASEMISTYTLELNRARQAAITQEISEIVAGANALS
ncbi:MAG: ATP synthase gamma chain [Candidatus Carbobacillus altaicus]|uniref:ATP synthase gamma chain n=1 Tax=Candidatus Carbonibacillus altaicus TaxID=2163959 RepID=A0A2R6Y3Z8_9BACL|nr:MAG: ATP synthase gamma chain [Candidatus Carbobacillus altaicus]